MKVASLLSVAIVFLLGSSLLAMAGSSSYALGGAATPTTTTTLCVPSADPFVVTAASWGTQAVPMNAGPGGSGASMTIDLLYTGGCALAGASFKLELPHYITTTYGTNSTTSYEVGIASDSILTESYRLDIASDAPLGTYPFSLYIGYNTTDFAGIFFQTVNFTLPVSGTPRLSFTSGTATLVPGKTNNLTLTIANTGTGTAYTTSTAITASSQAGVLNQIPVIQTLPPGSTRNETVQLFVPQTLTGSAVSLSVSSSYYDSSSFLYTSSQTLGFSVLESPSYSFSVSLAQVNSTSTVGSQSRLVFTLTNTGVRSIYSPTLSVVASSPVIVTGNVPASAQAVIAPGQTAKYYVTVGSSPSSAAGIYGGTATVTYYDVGGAQHSQSFPVGFILEGSIRFVFQDVTTSQSSTTLTVSGSLLNEGNSNAYYAEVDGRVGDPSAQNASAYVGEIDPNTPTPFTVTISMAAPARPAQGVPVALTVSYRDSFGATFNLTSSITTNLESAGQITLSNATTTSGSGTPGGDLVTVVSYSVIIVVAAVAIGAAVFVRRRRASSRPPKEDKVI